MWILTLKQQEALRNYQYHGGDPSLLYKYVLSPFAEFCVQQFVPVWVAPNLVTLLGLLISLAATIATLVYNPNLDSSAPGWVSVFSGVAIFLYQTLDNMDGKQARRTKSSSPLGLIFDHGCDAINASFLAISMGSVFAVGWNIKLLFGYFIGFVPFYFQTWEEYYTGSMILPAFNGPSEGLVMISIFSILTGVYGSDFWQIAFLELPSQLTAVLDKFLSRASLETYLGIKSVDQLLFVTPFQIVVVLGVVWTAVTLVVQFNAGAKAANKKKISTLRAALDLLPIILHYGSLFIYCGMSEIALQKYPFAILCLMSSVFVEIAVHVMVCHVTDIETEPFRRYLLICIPLLIYSTLKDGDKSEFFHEETILLATAGLVTFAVIVKLYLLCIEMSRALDIYVFKLGKRSKRA